MRSSTNADLAARHEFVLLIAVQNPRQASIPAMARAAQARLDGEIEHLRASGCRVELITPDDASADAFGPNLMDGSRRPEVVDAGLQQGCAEAARIATAWDAAAP